MKNGKTEQRGDRLTAFAVSKKSSSGAGNFQKWNELEGSICSELFQMSTTSFSISTFSSKEARILMQGPNDSDKIISKDELTAWKNALLSASRSSDESAESKDDELVSSLDVSDNSFNESSDEDTPLSKILPIHRIRRPRRIHKSCEITPSVSREILSFRDRTAMTRSSMYDNLLVPDAHLLPRKQLGKSRTSYEGPIQKSAITSLRALTLTNSIEEFDVCVEDKEGDPKKPEKSKRKRIRKSVESRKSWDFASSRIKSFRDSEVSQSRRKSLIREFWDGVTSSPADIESLEKILFVPEPELNKENLHVVFLHFLSKSSDCDDVIRISGIQRLIGLDGPCSCDQSNNCPRFVYYHLERRGLHQLMMKLSNSISLQPFVFDLAVTIDRMKDKSCKSLRRKSKSEDLITQIVQHLKKTHQEVTKESIERLYMYLINPNDLDELESQESSLIAGIFSQSVKYPSMFPTIITATCCLSEEDTIHESCRALCTLIIANVTNKRAVFESAFKSIVTECIPLIAKCNQMVSFQKISFSYVMNILSEILMVHIMTEKQKLNVKKTIDFVKESFFLAESKSSDAEDDIRVLFYSFISRFSSIKSSELDLDHVFMKNQLSVLDCLQSFILFPQDCEEPIHTIDDCILVDSFIVKYAVQFIRDFSKTSLLDPSAQHSKPNQQKAKRIASKFLTRSLFFLDFMEFLTHLSNDKVMSQDMRLLISRLASLAETNWKSGRTFKQSNFLPSTQQSKTIANKLGEYASRYMAQGKKISKRSISECGAASASTQMVWQYIVKWDCLGV